VLVGIDHCDLVAPLSLDDPLMVTIRESQLGRSAAIKVLARTNAELPIYAGK